MGSLFDALDREWDARFAGRPVPPPLRSLGPPVADLGGLVAWSRGADPGSADRLLAGLVRAFVTDDVGVAGRVVVQLLSPGLRRLAGRWWAVGEPEERDAAAVAALWCRLRRYPIERRPRAIAANLLLDSAKDLRRLARQGEHTAVCAEPERLAAPRCDDQDPGLELLELLSEAVQDGLLTAERARLVAETRIGGRRLRDLAPALGVSTRTLERRRRSAESALIGWAAA